MKIIFKLTPTQAAAAKAAPKHQQGDGPKMGMIGNTFLELVTDEPSDEAAALLFAIAGYASVEVAVRDQFRKLKVISIEGVERRPRWFESQRTWMVCRAPAYVLAKQKALKVTAKERAAVLERLGLTKAVQLIQIGNERALGASCTQEEIAHARALNKALQVA